MEPGSKCICSIDELYNGFGDKATMLTKGQRLTVSRSRNIFGTTFLYFKEIDDENCFMAMAFTPLRNLN